MVLKRRRESVCRDDLHLIEKKHGSISLRLRNEGLKNRSPGSIRLRADGSGRNGVCHADSAPASLPQLILLTRLILLLYIFLNVCKLLPSPPPSSRHSRLLCPRQAIPTSSNANVISTYRRPRRLPNSLSASSHRVGRLQRRRYTGWHEKVRPVYLVAHIFKKLSLLVWFLALTENIE